MPQQHLPIRKQLHLLLLLLPHLLRLCLRLHCLLLAFAAVQQCLRGCLSQRNLHKRLELPDLPFELPHLQQRKHLLLLQRFALPEWHALYRQLHRQHIPRPFLQQLFGLRRDLPHLLGRSHQLHLLRSLAGLLRKQLHRELSGQLLQHQRDLQDLRKLPRLHQRHHLHHLPSRILHLRRRMLQLVSNWLHLLGADADLLAVQLQLRQLQRNRLQLPLLRRQPAPAERSLRKLLPEWLHRIRRHLHGLNDRQHHLLPLQHHLRSHRSHRALLQKQPP